MVVSCVAAANTDCHRNFVGIKAAALKYNIPGVWNYSIQYFIFVAVVDNAILNNVIKC